MDIRLKSDDFKSSVSEDMKQRGFVFNENTKLVIIVNGSEVTEDFVVEVRDIDLPSKSAAPPSRLQRAASRAVVPSSDFVPGNPGSDEESLDPFGEQAGEEETGNDQGVDASISEGLDNPEDGSETEGSDLSDFSDEKNLGELARMMSPKDRQKALNLQRRQQNGHSLTRAPTESKSYRSLRAAGKEPGDISGEV